MIVRFRDYDELRKLREQNRDIVNPLWSDPATIIILPTVRVERFVDYPCDVEG